ncbi:beta-ketoacyl-[acyl-carrier-protein] synthase family protein [Endozoicomonas atrinae]|uniref:beta-ketoacyl-[acyl-carrier-protein] synthase family protein n=1 Tax=Endozoicomonas atrinae TaxID=1333660 RepID=UPI0008257172|nr:beta-ketoacyl-[acyl-carrier-protein] synthase family protein [Endozoicomonas atrinae]
MSSSPFFLSAMGMVCALGSGHEEILANLLSGSQQGMVEDTTCMPGKAVTLGKVCVDLPVIETKGESSRNNRLLLAAFESIQGEVDRLVQRFGADRVGIVLGTSTSGTIEAEQAMIAHLSEGEYPSHYQYRIQEMGDPSRFLAGYLGLTGPAYTVSTACSSSGKVFASGRNLIRTGLCDAVIVGGVDSLCQLTVHGFSALESVSTGICQPFSVNRDGINIGEGAALFTMTTEAAPVALLGVGESSDAWHISAPHPEGKGAQKAMECALEDAGLQAEEIHYLNLHGTATPLNDAMESQAVFRVFGDKLCCSSSKTMTGHTLGAAGAIEAGLCWLLLSSMNDNGRLPPHLWDGQPDPELADIALTHSRSSLPTSPWRMMSNSFAFGGSNVSLILGQTDTEATL